MLVGMDMPAAAPWIVLGVALGMLLLALAALISVWLFRWPRAGDPSATAPGARDGGREDDLAHFLDHPPGFPGARNRPADGWAPLLAPARAAEPVAAGHGPGHLTSGRVLGATAAVALLLAGATAAVVTGLDPGPQGGRDHDGRPGTAQRLDREGIEARLSFGGLILERRAVGVTATYPELRLTGDGTDAMAEVALPTWNCLADEAPVDPVAAGCRRSIDEHAELGAPRLEVTGTAGDGLRIAGRFPTVTRPNGTPPVATGRTYELLITVVAGERPSDGWLPATGVLRLGDDRTRTTGTDTAAEVNVLRYLDR
jgi:hypothetical protein